MLMIIPRPIFNWNLVLSLVARFMVSSLKNLVNSLGEVIHKIKCKYKHNNKKCETCRVD